MFKKTTSILATVFSLLIFLLSQNAYSNELYSAYICDSCNSTNDFELLAKSTNTTGLHVIINTDTRETRTYRTIYEPSLGGMLAISEANPQEVTNSLPEVWDILDAAENLSTFLYAASSTTGSGPNGCGGDGSSINAIVPQEDFREACNLHDQCFADGLGLDYCNTKFETDMAEIIAIKLAEIENENYFKRALIKAKLKAIEKAFRFFVKKFGVEFYCKGGLNADQSECLLLNGQFDGDIQSLGIVGSRTTAFESISGLDLNLVCDVVSYRVYRNGEPGFIQTVENCRLVPRS